MGKAVRNKETGFIGTWQRWGEPLHNPETEELVDIELEDIVKPSEQIEAEAVAAKEAILAELQSTASTHTVEGYSERARILFAMEVANVSRAMFALIDGAIMSNWTTPEELRVRWRESIAAPLPPLKEEHVAAALAAKQAQAVGVN